MNFYFEAAKTIDRLDAKEGSIKGVLSSLPGKVRARTAALVIETLKYKPVLIDVIDASKLLLEEKRKITSLNLALVLVHDVLLSNGIEAGDGPVKQAVLRHKTRLHSEFQKIKVKRGVKSNLELVQTADHRAAQIPRYVRVNTLLWNAEDAVRHYIARGFELSGPFSSKKGFSRDDHVPDLLLFNPQMEFHKDSAYTSGKIILQDKASCFPALVLAPPAEEDSCVIDATAAPGNKTSHLSALMGNNGKLFAFERDKRRFQTLKTMLSKAACKNVEAVNSDFLTIDPMDAKYSAVAHILLDPSCSGSGIVNRLDYLLDTEEEDNGGQEERLQKLSAFQLSMINHAMKFPSVKKIVYSTCSVHATENEQVVRHALESQQSGRFKLASPSDVLPTWPRRGLAEEMSTPDDALSLIRCNPGEDATNGFFVSCFVVTDADATLNSSGGNGNKRKTEEDDAPKKAKKKRRRPAKPTDS